MKWKLLNIQIFQGAVFMELYLELLPYHYYNALDSDVELIAHIFHIHVLIVFNNVKPLYIGV